jgi:uncharacterized protein (DUF2141 family)
MKLNVVILILSLTGLSWFQTSCKKPADEIQPAPELNENGDTSSLVIQVKGLKNTNGKVNIALYNSGSSFNNSNQAFKTAIVPINAIPLEILFDSLPPGEYAFAVFHDENSNQNLDQNFLGIPKEGFGFSNNASGSFGPPSYENAKFNVPSQSRVTQLINLVFY